MLVESTMKILIVDEFAASRKVLRNTLEQLGFDNMEEVSDGYSALVRLKSALVDLVIVDWEMSEMCGLELLQKIRANVDLKHIPVMMVTGDPFPEKTVAATKAGVNAYLIKPFEVSLFSAKMENIFKADI